MNIFLNQINSSSKYYKWYRNICLRAINRILPNTIYTETHHILPKSIYPQYAKDKNNLVTLTAREHFICHWLLTKFIKDSKIVYAFQMMIPNKTSNRYLPKSSIVYKKLKEQFFLNNQGSKNCKWYTNGVENKMFKTYDVIPLDFVPGRTFSINHKNKLKGIPKSTEQKQKQSIAMQGKPGVSGNNNPAKRPEVREKIRKARLGSTASDETKLKMKLSKIGKKRGSYKIKSKDCS
jgi:hypothetical protein